MFKVYNHNLQKIEFVEKIDYNKHWKDYLVPFETEQEEIIEEVEEEIEEEKVPETVQETVQEKEISPTIEKKRGRPKTK